ncbi:MAG: GNAT family N-acetyltransferase [Patescibacteria group bacterium]|nr:GNAT family N-acetyltransferase [Patescibacteria group bacterium]
MKTELPEIQLQPLTLSEEDIAKYLAIEKSIEAPFVEITTDADEARTELRDTEAQFILYKNKIVGCIAYQKREGEKGPYGYLWEIAISPEFQGHRIGEAALQRVLKVYEALPFVSLQVDPENARALALYERLGFVIQKRIENATENGRPRLLLMRFN